MQTQTTKIRAITFFCVVSEKYVCQTDFLRIDKSTFFQSQHVDHKNTTDTSTHSNKSQ